MPAIRFGPGSETLPQAIAAIGMLRGDIALLQRIGLQIVELFASIADAVDVLPVRLANRKAKVIFSDVEVRATRMALLEKAAALPVWRGRQSDQLGDRRCQIHMTTDHRHASGRLVHAWVPHHQRHVHVLFVHGAALNRTCRVDIQTPDRDRP